MGSAAIAIIGSIAASLIIAYTSLQILKKTQRAEDNRARQRDLEHLRDAKGERLRGLYAPLVDYSFLLERVTHEMGFPRRGEEWEEKLKRHETEMALGHQKVERARVGIVLEPGTAPVWKAYEATTSAWWTVHESIRVVLEGIVHIEERDFNDTLARAQSASLHLRETALAQISECAQPIEEPTVS